MTETKKPSIQSQILIGEIKFRASLTTFLIQEIPKNRIDETIVWMITTIDKLTPLLLLQRNIR